jgi:solute:Na+ symporter, SSS family
MLLGMFWIRTTPFAAFWGLIAGMLTSISIFLGFKMNLISASVAQMITLSSHPSDMTRNLWQAVWAWVICFVLTVVLSFFSKPKPREELIGLVKGLTPMEEQKNLPLYKKPEAVAVVAIIVFVILNIYFW